MKRLQHLSFLIDGFSSPFRLDQNRNVGSILVCVRSDIPSKFLRKYSFPNDIEGLFVEIHFKNSKWLLFGTYHSLSQNNQYCFDCLYKILYVYSSYEKVILTGDFNAQDYESVFDSLLYQHRALFFGWRMASFARGSRFYSPKFPGAFFFKKK